ncbi:MAG TPA: hypothetical protein VNZ85_18400 [Caulobacter sp.]|nr:hypothetical protein [Caulobacter sp.]
MAGVSSAVMGTELTDILAAKRAFQENWAIGGSERNLKAAGKSRFVSQSDGWAIDFSFDFVGQVLVRCQGSVSLRHRAVDRIIHAALSEQWPGVSRQAPIALVSVDVPVVDDPVFHSSVLHGSAASRAASWWASADAAEMILRPLQGSPAAYMDYLKGEQAWVFTYEPSVSFLVLLGENPDAAWQRAADRLADSGTNAAFFEWCERNREAATQTAAEIYR